MVPIMLRIRSVHSALKEPPVLIARMVDNKINQQLHVTFLHLSNKLVHVRKGSIWRMDVFVIGYVIAHVRLRRGIVWGQPDDINAEVFEIIQSADYARDIAQAITS